MTSDLFNIVHNLPALEVAKMLPDESIHCVVTSPPYFGARDYGIEGQYGRETTVKEFVDNLVTLFDELRRVLTKDGTVWLNLGDSYVGSTSQHKDGGSQGHNSVISPKTMSGVAQTGRKERSNALYNSGLQMKQLIGVPWRVAFALQDAGWWLRSDIIWHKPNPMPGSQKDRPTSAHEHIFLLTKSAHYYYDIDAVKTPVKPHSIKRLGRAVSATHKMSNGAPGQTPHGISHARKNTNKQDGAGNRPYNGFNERYDHEENPMATLRDVWVMPTAQYRGGHFAVFPLELPRRCIALGCPPNGIVMDPFMGTGTTADAAVMLGRGYVGAELNPSYVDEYKTRLGKPLQMDLTGIPLFAQAVNL
jgi:DNA modification methylase